MPDELDTRIRRAMRDEVSELPMVVSEQMVIDHAGRASTGIRIGTALWAVGAAAASIVLVFMLTDTPSGLGSGGVGGPVTSQLASPNPTDRVLLLPVGVYQTVLPLDGICFALAVEQPGQPRMPLQWWRPASEDTCSTRLAELSVAEAELVEFPLLRLNIPESESANQWRFRVTGVPEGEIRIARNMEHETALKRVDVVDPTLVPTP